MKFLWLDEVYSDAWRAIGEDARRLHGTADYWDVALRDVGHDSDTFIENSAPDQMPRAIGFAKPDVLCVQNVGRWPARSLREFKCKKVAFVSYRATDADMADWDCVFTSFPWLVQYLKRLGRRVEFLPLAFGLPLLDRIEVPENRDLPLTFLGGIGHRHIWQKGTDVIAAVAETFPDHFQWWGYRPHKLPEALEQTWQGEAWGRYYFQLLIRSRITLNRHGEIAQGFANNMRLFEATGCGACLVTEHAPNLDDYLKPGVDCLTYKSADDLIYVLRTLLDKPDAAERIGLQGCKRCLVNHCYENRVRQFLDVVESL